MTHALHNGMKDVLAAHPFALVDLTLQTQVSTAFARHQPALGYFTVAKGNRLTEYRLAQVSPHCGSSLLLI